MHYMTSVNSPTFHLIFCSAFYYEYLPKSFQLQDVEPQICAKETKSLTYRCLSVPGHSLLYMLCLCAWSACFQVACCCTWSACGHSLSVSRLLAVVHGLPVCMACLCAWSACFQVACCCTWSACVHGLPVSRLLAVVHGLPVCMVCLFPGCLLLYMVCLCVWSACFQWMVFIIFQIVLDLSVSRLHDIVMTTLCMVYIGQLLITRIKKRIIKLTIPIL